MEPLDRATAWAYDERGEPGPFVYQRYAHPTGAAAEERLAEVKITVNRNTVPFDERPPTVASGVRMGTPACTMRGFDADDFREVGRIAAGALQEDADVEALAERSHALCERNPLYPGFRGWATYEA